jgi:glycosyltransferase involved in cell wall biosynthesis
MTPSVSVLVNTYNHERFIAQCLQSVLDQTFPADQMEIIVVDDGSTDSTPQITQSFIPRSRPSINYVRKPNGGQVSAFHAGVALARGEIIAFLDGDDYWAPNKISAVLAAFEENPAVAAVGHAYHEVDENGRSLATMIPTADRVNLNDASFAQSACLLGVFLGTSRFAIRRAVLEKTLPVPPDLPFFDTFVYSQAVAISGAILLPEPLCYYRLHHNNLWALSGQGERVLWTRYRLLNALLTHLPPRLASLGVPEDTIAAFLSADRQDANRLRLKLEGGKRADTFRVERAAFHVSYRNPDFGYRLFKAFVLFLTLLLPPRAFYRIRDWYARKNFSRARRLVGDAETIEVPTFTQRREIAVPNGRLK